jgi:hypothetical protein
VATWAPSTWNLRHHHHPPRRSQLRQTPPPIRRTQRIPPPFKPSHARRDQDETKVRRCYGSPERSHQGFREVREARSARSNGLPSDRGAIEAYAPGRGCSGGAPTAGRLGRESLASSEHPRARDHHGRLSPRRDRHASHHVLAHQPRHVLLLRSGPLNRHRRPPLPAANNGDKTPPRLPRRHPSSRRSSFQHHHPNLPRPHIP